jgi:acyl-CoA thioesterase I
VKRILIGSAASAAGATLAGAGAAAYVNRMVQGRATGDIEGFLDRADPDPGDVAVVLGDSLIRGRAGVDAVELLRNQYPQISWINGGVQGDTSFDLAERLVPVVGCHANQVIIMIGTNDVRATLFPDNSEIRRKVKALPEPPSTQWFDVYLDQIVTELQKHTGATVAVCSIPPLGQELSSEVNQRVEEFNDVIRTLCERSGATYLPVFERFSEVLREAKQDNVAPYSANWRKAARSLSAHYIVGRSYDQIAEREGLLLSPDRVHFTTAAAQIVAELVGGFVTGDIAARSASD